MGILNLSTYSFCLIAPSTRREIRATLFGHPVAAYRPSMNIGMAKTIDSRPPITIAEIGRPLGSARKSATIPRTTPRGGPPTKQIPARNPNGDPQPPPVTSVSATAIQGLNAAKRANFPSDMRSSVVNVSPLGRSSLLLSRPTLALPSTRDWRLRVGLLCNPRDG